MRYLIAIFIQIIFLSNAFATEAIPNPQLLFDYPDHLSNLEKCILADLTTQSPDHLKELFPATSPGNVDGQPKSIVEMISGAVTTDGKRILYRVRFMTPDGADWLYFQSGELIGVYSTGLSTSLVVLKRKTDEIVFTADISNCK